MGQGRTIEGNLMAAAARARGEKRYFTGLPCKSGHVAERQISNGTCVECLEERRKANMHWFRDHDKKRQQTPERRADKAASERKNRKKESRKAANAALRMKRIASQLQRTPPWADLLLIREFYNEAARLTKETGEPWHVDHEIPLNGKLVSGLHLAENLRVIKGIENLKKGAQFNTN
jgi:hypothetical protein